MRSTVLRSAARSSTCGNPTKRATTTCSGPARRVSERAQLVSDEDGRFHFRSIVAHCYPIPHDGPVGDLLTALGRHPWRPAHLHFRIEAPGYERLITHIFRRGDPHLESDAVFGVRSTLVADWVRHEPAGTEPYYALDYDFVLHRRSR